MKRVAAAFLLVLVPLGAWGQDRSVDPNNLQVTVRVKTADGQPAAGAEVQLVWDDGLWLPRTEPLRPDERHTTGADGSVTVSGLKNGNCDVRVLHPQGGAYERFGLSPQDSPLERTLTLRAFPPLEGVVRDAQGQPVADALFVWTMAIPVATTAADGTFRIEGFDRQPYGGFALVKPGYCWMPLDRLPEGDRIELTFPRGTTIEGTLTFPDGKPAAGATLYYRGSAPAETDAQGRFRTLPLPPGENVTIYGSHGADGQRFSVEKQVTVGEGPVQTESVVLQAFLQTGVTGKVLRKDTGEPVRARLLVGSTAEFAFPDEKGRTDADGNFELKDLPAKPVWIAAYPSDPRLYAVEGVVGVDLSNGEPVRDLTFHVEDGAAVRGVVLGPDGQPVNAQITVSPSRRYQVFQTRGGGRFTLANLAEADTELTLSVAPSEGEGTVVKVGPVPKGQMLDNVEIRVGAKPAEGVIHLAVVDTQGKPLPGVEIITQPAGTRAEPTTDTAGNLEVRFFKPGQYRFEAYVADKAGPDERRHRLLRDVRFVEGQTLDVEEGKTYRHRLVLDVAPLRAVAGQVTDDQGRPLRAEVTLLAAQGVQHGADSEPGGWFYARRVPDGPFLLEVRSQGYRPVLLESGKDFDPGNLDMRVTLKPGPFGEGEDILAAVTGRKREELKDGLLGVDLEPRERMYEESARPAEQQRAAVPDGRQVTAPAGLSFRVVDAEGRPVTRIYLEGADAYDINGPVTAEMARPRGPRKLMEGKDGRYTAETTWFPGFFVSAEGTGAVFVPIQMQAQPSPELLTVTLQPAASVTVRVEDYEGKPRAGVPVGPAGFDYRFMSTNFQSLPRTNGKGVVTFERLTPGRYSFSAYEPREIRDNAIQEPRTKRIPTAVLDVKPGQSAETTLRSGVPAEGTPEAVVQAWWDALAKGWPQIGEVPLPPKPEGRMRAKVANVVVKEIDRLTGAAQHEMDDAWILARMAQEMGLEKAAPALDRLLRRWTLDVAGTVLSDQAAMGVTEALAALAGNDAVDTFVAVASDPKMPYFVQRDALIGLGRVGTPEAVAAYARLRDAAYGKPGAPERKAEYTHAERMEEAVRMVFEVIPQDGPGGMKVQTDRAWVSEDFQTGKVYYGHEGMTMEIELKRFGDEWLVTDILSTTVV